MRAMINLNVYRDTREALAEALAEGETVDAGLRRLFGLPRLEAPRRYAPRRVCRYPRPTLPVRQDTHDSIALLALPGESFEDLVRAMLGLPMRTREPVHADKTIGSLMEFSKAARGVRSKRVAA